MRENRTVPLSSDKNSRLLTDVTDGFTTSYTYNADNLRQTKTVDGVTTSHIWDGSNIVMETNGTAVNRYYRGANGIAYADFNGAVSYYQKDAHGDVTALADANGSITKNYQFDAFGNELSQSDNDINPFRYCGEYYDAETGTIYLRNRYYDPSSGRFISEDPIKDGLNWYVYCSNNPIKYVDPSGLVVTIWDRENLSNKDLQQIKKNDKIWNNGNEKEKEIAKISSYNIRKKYLSEGQKLLDNGYVEEKISNDMYMTTSISGTNINVKVDIERIYTEKFKYVSLDKIDVNIKTSSGFSVNSMKIYSGQYGLLSERMEKIVSIDKNNYLFEPNWGSVVDDGGAYTIIGTSVELSVSRKGGQSYSSTIFNQLYDQELIDEDGKIKLGVDGFSILQEALMRGER